MQAELAPPTMELFASVSIPNSKQREYVIDREELLHLLESGLIHAQILCLSGD